MHSSHARRRAPQAVIKRAQPVKIKRAACEKLKSLKLIMLVIRSLYSRGKKVGSACCSNAAGPSGQASPVQQIGQAVALVDDLRPEGRALKFNVQLEDREAEAFVFARGAHLAELLTRSIYAKDWLCCSEPRSPRKRLNIY